MSLLDILDEISTPTQLAQKALKEDDAIALKRLLIKAINTTTDQLKLVGEHTLMNRQAGENLLSCAVYEDAANCVRLLIGREYKWSPDRRNLIGRTPAQLAERRGYLPVWFPLVAHSSEAGVLWSSSNSDTVPHALAADTRSVAYLLIYPHEVLQDPINVLQQMTFNLEIDRPGRSLAIVERSGEINWKLSAANVALFFELFISTPGVVEPPWARNLRFWPCSRPTEHDATQCTIYPNCLRIHQTPTDHRPHEFSEIFNVWKAHRLLRKDGLGSVSVTSDGEVASNFDWAPMRLDETCRVLIRRLLAINLHNRAGQSPSSALNYAHSVNQLPLPVRVKSFLAYEELWPVLPRHQVPLMSRRVPGWIGRVRHIYAFDEGYDEVG